MDDSRYVHHCHLYQVNMTENGRNCWALHVKNLLFSYGFGEVWIMQGVGDERLFLNLFKQRCRDIDGQGWVNGLSESPKLDTYKHFKSLLQYESYLSNIDKMIFRTTLCRFRASNHNLAIEKGRRDGVSRDRRICIFCNIGNFIEDEFHFCLICPVYQQLRELYIPQYFFQPPSQFKFYSLMRTNHVHTQNNLAKFVFFAFRLRQSMID